MTRHRIHLYHDPETSESAGEWDTFTEAFAFGDPTCKHSELVANGETLARAVKIDGRWGWAATQAGLARVRTEVPA